MVTVVNFESLTFLYAESVVLWQVKVRLQKRIDLPSFRSVVRTVANCAGDRGPYTASSAFVESVFEIWRIVE